MNAIFLVLMMNKADGRTPRSSIVKLSRTISKRNDTISGIHQQHETSFETTLAALQTRGGTLTARMNNRASPRRWQRRRFGMYTALTYIILYHVVVKYGPIAFATASLTGRLFHVKKSKSNVVRRSSIHRKRFSYTVTIDGQKASRRASVILVLRG
jgi:hypothetical protein